MLIGLVLLICQFMGVIPVNASSMDPLPWQQAMIAETGATWMIGDTGIVVILQYPVQIEIGGCGGLTVELPAGTVITFPPEYPTDAPTQTEMGTQTELESESFARGQFVIEQQLGETPYIGETEKNIRRIK